MPRDLFAQHGGYSTATAQSSSSIITGNTHDQVIASYASDALVWNAWTTNTTTAVTYELELLNTWTTWVQVADTSQVLQISSPTVQGLVLRQEEAQLLQPTDQVLAMLKKDRAVKRLARIRAERILTDHLSAEQAKDLKTFGFFKLYVQSKTGETRVYRIRRGQVRNVDLVLEGPNGLEPIKTLCAHPEMMVPDADAMLIQKLMLESAEEEFLKIANHMSPVAEAMRPPRTPLFDRAVAIARSLRTPRVDPATRLEVDALQRDTAMRLAG